LIATLPTDAVISGVANRIVVVAVCSADIHPIYIKMMTGPMPGISSAAVGNRAISNDPAIVWPLPFVLATSRLSLSIGIAIAIVVPAIFGRVTSIAIVVRAIFGRTRFCLTTELQISIWIDFALTTGLCLWNDNCLPV
jgi:hypothetical protein